MKEPKEQTLQEVLEWLMQHFAESRIYESIMETRLAVKDQVQEVNDEEQEMKDEEIMEEKKPNFEA